MDLSPSLVTEQSSFHLWCRPRRRARAAPRCALRQVERWAQDLPLSTRSLPARAVPAAAGGEEPSLPQRLFPARWSWGGGAGRHTKFPPAARFQRVPWRCPRDDSRNDATCTKNESFLYCSLFFPTREAFVSEQDASVWGERQWCGSARSARAHWKWHNSWVNLSLPPF